MYIEVTPGSRRAYFSRNIYIFNFLACVVSVIIIIIIVIIIY